MTTVDARAGEARDDAGPIVLELDLFPTYWGAQVRSWSGGLTGKRGGRIVSIGIDGAGGS